MGSNPTNLTRTQPLQLEPVRLRPGPTQSTRTQTQSDSD